MRVFVAQNRHRENRKRVPEVVLVCGVKNRKRFFAEHRFQNVRTECTEKHRKKTRNTRENKGTHGAEAARKSVRQRNPMLPEALTRHEYVLASASPRRREVMERLGFRISVQPAAIDELAIRHSDAAEQTRLIAQAKADAIWSRGLTTVAADTVVVLNGDVLEKPTDRQDADRMLRRLSGRDHKVYTAVSLKFPAGEHVAFLEETAVYFLPLSDAVITDYIATDAPYDKAGGYGVQDAFGMAYIRRVEGCYFNVMGFPASRFVQVLSANQKFLL